MSRFNRLDLERLGTWPIMTKNLHGHLSLLYLGPLHTQAKSHDHVIVRAQKQVSKGRPNTSP